MKVATPFGEFPFEFRRLERRNASLVVVGILGGFETSVIVESADLRRIARGVAIPAVAAALLIAYRRRR